MYLLILPFPFRLPDYSPSHRGNSNNRLDSLTLKQRVIQSRVFAESATDMSNAMLAEVTRGEIVQQLQFLFEVLIPINYTTSKQLVLMLSNCSSGCILRGGGGGGGTTQKLKICNFVDIHLNFVSHY